MKMLNSLALFMLNNSFYGKMNIKEGSIFTCNPIETRSMSVRQKDIQLKMVKQEDEEFIRRTRFYDSDPNIRIKAMKAKPKFKRKNG